MATSKRCVWCIQCCCECKVDFNDDRYKVPVIKNSVIPIVSAPSQNRFPASEEVSRISLNPFTGQYEYIGPPRDIYGRIIREKKSVPAPFPSLHEELPFAMAQPLKPIEGCLPGLEHLYDADQFFVQHCREIHSINALLDYDSRDRYQIMNKDGMRIYYAVGESNCWRWGLSGARPFRIKIMDHHGNLILTLKRPWTFGLCWFGGECTGNKCEVRYSAGKILGRVKQRIRCISPVFDVLDVNNNYLMCAKGPPISCCPFICLKYYAKFLLFNPEAGRDVHAGKFVEFPFGIGPHNSTNALSLSFPVDLDVETKALLLALLFVVHCMYFEVSDVIPGLSAVRDSKTITSNRVSDWINPNRVPFKRMNAGDVPGKCYACKVIGIFGTIVLIIYVILWATDDWSLEI